MVIEIPQIDHTFRTRFNPTSDPLLWWWELSDSVWREMFYKRLTSRKSSKKENKESNQTNQQPNQTNPHQPIPTHTNPYQTITQKNILKKSSNQTALSISNFHPGHICHLRPKAFIVAATAMSSESLVTSLDALALHNSKALDHCRVTLQIVIPKLKMFICSFISKDFSIWSFISKLSIWSFISKDFFWSEAWCWWYELDQRSNNLVAESHWRASKQVPGFVVEPNHFEKFLQ